jgi:hypothetical protein
LLPIFLLAIAALFLGGVFNKPSVSGATIMPLILIVTFSTWMSLGPSIKFDSQKPPGVPSNSMIESYAISPSGNQALSDLPGLSAMRASYRWSALSTVGLLAVVSLASSQMSTRRKRSLALMGVGALIFLLPDPLQHFESKARNQSLAHEIERHIVSQFSADLKGAEGVLFLPVGNDLFANYLSARADFRTFNVGGDKNISSLVGDGWPIDFRLLNTNSAEPELLSRSGVRYIVVPSFSLERKFANSLCASEYSGPLCPGTQDFKTKAIPTRTLQSLGKPLFQRKLYSVYEVPVYDSETPTSYSAKEKKVLFSSVLGRGWHNIEDTLVWSKQEASIRLTLPSSCSVNTCKVTLHYDPFIGVIPREALFEFVHVNSKGSTLVVKRQHSLSGPKSISFVLHKNDKFDLDIIAHAASSPTELGLSSDSRILGLALYRIEVSQ